MKIIKDINIELSNLLLRDKENKVTDDHIEALSTLEHNYDGYQMQRILVRSGRL